jgi:hypothetical protein
MSTFSYPAQCEELVQKILESNRIFNEQNRILDRNDHKLKERIEKQKTVITELKAKQEWQQNTILEMIDIIYELKNRVDSLEQR